METILSTDGLSKIYKSLAAVDKVSLTVNKGDIYGFVGLNGSGKTTFIRLVTSLIRANSGTFQLFGKSGKDLESLKRISSMVETPSIYMNLNAADNIRAQCGIAGIEKSKAAETVGSLLELVGLHDTGKKKAKNFSLGMRQRLGIAMALVGDPEFMLLDEPTNGLDPGGIIEIRELLQKLNRERGITILISSHILSELGKLATRYGFIHKGKLIREISADEMHAACPKKLYVEVDKPRAAAEVLEKNNIGYELRGFTFTLPGTVTVTKVFRMMDAANVEVRSAQTVTDDLEGYFMNLIGGLEK